MKVLSIMQATDRIDHYIGLMVNAMDHDFKFTTLSVYLTTCIEGIETVVNQYEITNQKQFAPKTLKCGITYQGSILQDVRD